MNKNHGDNKLEKGEELSEEQIEKYKKAIDKLTYDELIFIRRRARPNHPIFRRDLPLLQYFEERIKRLSPFKEVE